MTIDTQNGREEFFLETKLEIQQQKTLP